MKRPCDCVFLDLDCDLVSCLADERCVFKGSEASCRTTVADRLQADIDVSIDTCSEPVDITIHVQVPLLQLDSPRRLFYPQQKTTLKLALFTREALCERLIVFLQVARNLSVWSWRHSFVNPDETQPLSNLRSDISLHVSMKPVEATKLHVVAEFISHDHLQPFLDDFVDSRRHPCHMKGERELCLSLFVSYRCSFRTVDSGLEKNRR